MTIRGLEKAALKICGNLLRLCAREVTHIDEDLSYRSYDDGLYYKRNITIILYTGINNIRVVGRL